MVNFNVLFFNFLGCMVDLYSGINCLSILAVIWCTFATVQGIQSVTFNSKLENSGSVNDVRYNFQWIILADT